MKGTEVEVKMLCSGVCASDVDALDKTSYAFKFPMVAGHEGIGLVTAVGPLVRNLKVGSRVGLGVYRDKCGSCTYCHGGDNNICPGRELLFASGKAGAFGEYVRIQAEFAIPIPEPLETTFAAPLLCAGVTVFAPMREHHLTGGDRVGIVGIGGLGHLALQFANKLGCEVYAFSSTPDKADFCKQLGAHHYINMKNPDDVKSAANKLKLIILTSSGDDGLDWNALIGSLAPKGRLVLCGIALRRDIPVAPISLLLGSKAIFGSAAGSTGLALDMLNFAAFHNIKPMIEKFPIEKVNEVFAKVREGKVRFRAVVCHDNSLL